MCSTEKSLYPFTPPFVCFCNEQFIKFVAVTQGHFQQDTLIQSEESIRKIHCFPPNTIFAKGKEIKKQYKLRNLMLRIHERLHVTFATGDSQYFMLNGKSPKSETGTYRELFLLPAAHDLTTRNSREGVSLLAHAFLFNFNVR